jgi:hypothetical protein
MGSPLVARTCPLWSGPTKLTVSITSRAIGGAGTALLAVVACYRQNYRGERGLGGLTRPDHISDGAAKGKYVESPEGPDFEDRAAAPPYLGASAVATQQALRKCYSLAVAGPGVGQMRRREFFSGLDGAALRLLSTAAISTLVVLLSITSQAAEKENLCHRAFDGFNFLDQRIVEGCKDG